MPNAPGWSEYRSHVDKMVMGALAAVEPGAAVRRILQLNDGRLRAGRFDYDLDAGNLYLIAVGKAARPMAAALVEKAGPTIQAGVVISKQGGPAQELSPGLRIDYYQAAHPVPDESSLEATRAAFELLATTVPGDLVLCLISGGASALLTLPLISLAHWQELIDALLASGCTITELNTVRQHLDQVKGGGLAIQAAPASCLSLILSDVVGNPLSFIGSGPTVRTRQRPNEVRQLLARYAIQQRVSAAAWSAIEAALGRPRASGPWPTRLDYLIVGDVRLAARGAAAAARRLGFSTRLLTSHLEGEAREVGRLAAALAIDLPPGHCLLLGGESTVTIRGDGLGGRNQEIALAAALALEGRSGIALASFATDGEDGPTDAAGALVTGESADAMRAAGIDPRAGLDRNDSYRCFAALGPSDPGGLIRTGSTGTNVNDLIVLLRYAPD